MSRPPFADDVREGLKYANQNWGRSIDQSPAFSFQGRPKATVSGIPAIAFAVGKPFGERTRNRTGIDRAISNEINETLTAGTTGEIMLISFDKSFLFIHVPKTGGTSMRAVLQRHAHQPQFRPPNRYLERMGISVNHLLGNYKDYRFRTHERADVVARRLPDDVFDRLYKFGFVRNPWDLLPSLYRFILKNKKHKRHGIVSKMQFREFVEYAAVKNIANQSRLINAANGASLLDFVGRFERLSEDYKVISSQIGLEIPLPHLNRTEAKSLSDYYDAQSIRCVQRAYCRDLETFDYPDHPYVPAAA